MQLFLQVGSNPHRFDALQFSRYRTEAGAVEEMNNIRIGGSDIDGDRVSRSECSRVPVQQSNTSQK